MVPELDLERIPEFECPEKKERSLKREWLGKGLTPEEILRILKRP